MAGINFDSAKEIINGGIPQAQELLKDNGKVNDLLSKVGEKVKELEKHVEKIPFVGKELAGVPNMISMVKCYITKEYQETSLKTIAIIVSAFIYIVKKDDIISDSKGIIGYVDDIVVAKVAMNWIKPDLEKFKTWKENKDNKTE